MPARTQLFNQLPWNGGVNTSVDDALISPNQLVQADNVLFDTSGSRRRRDGINYDFDDLDNSNQSIYGLFEFWFGVTTRQKKFISINNNREVRGYTTGGVSQLLTDAGFPWSGTTDQASCITFNNLALIAVNGSTNFIKKWNGTDNSYSDLKNKYNQKLVSLGRTSSGTTRTLILSESFKGVNGDYISVSSATGPNASFYQGTFLVTNVTTTNVSNDTLTYTGVGNLTESVTDTSLTVDGLAPNGSILREHLGRVWTNDKSNPDRLHYSGTGNHEKWLGFDDSAAIDIGLGDGDPVGITAIFPTFKGELFVAKSTKLYRISGYSPETFSIQLVSSGIGCVSHNSIVAVGQDDMFFVSEKGIHSIAATSNYGDFGNTYISADIQKIFNQNFSKPLFKYVQGAYIPTYNSICWAFTDTNLPNPVNTNLAVNNSVWFYNIPLKAWYRWPDLPCQSLLVSTDGDQKRLYMGSHTNRILRSSTGDNFDLDYTGAMVGIKLKLVTGQIMVDNSIYNVKGFKRFLLYYKPKSTASIMVSIKIDNFMDTEVNELMYNESPIGDVLGETFILGESVLGAESRLAAYNRLIDGFGRFLKITITNEEVNKVIEIQGFGIEWEPAGQSFEAVAGV